MKAKLIVANWLFAWSLLCYSGDDLFIAMCIIGWFGFSTLLLNKNIKAAIRELIKFEKWVDRLIIKH